MIIKSVLENLEWGRNFLRNSQLRSLRNLSWMPDKARFQVLDSMEVNQYERMLIVCWIDFCQVKTLFRQVAKNFWEYYLNRGQLYKDDYLYCYTPQLELTQHGQRMKDETYRAQART